MHHLGGLKRSPYVPVLQLPDIGDADYMELESQLTSAAAAVIASLEELLAAAKGSPVERRMAAVGGFTQAYQEFLRAGMNLAAVCRVRDNMQSTGTEVALIMILCFMS